MTQHKNYSVRFSKTEQCYNIEMGDQGFCKTTSLILAYQIAAAPMLFEACEMLVNSVAERDDDKLNKAIGECSKAVILACVGTIDKFDA
jgi:hypothetical protein